MLFSQYQNIVGIFQLISIQNDILKNLYIKCFQYISNNLFFQEISLETVEKMMVDRQSIFVDFSDR